MELIRDDVGIIISPETERVEYTPNPIDEYLVIVNMPEDWEVVHNYIIEENEIDGIPNRRISCTNIKEYSLRASVYEMSVEEAETLRTHPKIESVELNPARYPQPRSLDTLRFKKNVAFNKPGVTAGLDDPSPSTAHTNGIRSNWSITFANTPSSEPYRGAGPAAQTYDITVTTPGFNYDLSGTDRNGAVSGTQPTVTVNIGDTINFNLNNVSTSHPFYIRVSDGGANVSTPAATGQGSTGTNTVSWTPNTAGTYYYQCGNHSTMIGTIAVNDGSITPTTIHNTDVSYSLTGKNVDAVIIDEGCGVVHPEFIADDGTYRAKDLILDGPYKVDPDYFTTNNHTYTKIIDGVNLGVGIATVAARNWWTNSSNRSAAFQSLGTISSIDSRYTVGHSQSKTANSDSNQITGGHGTACASQVGGKSFGLAFESNIWSIRINFGDAYVDASEALDICTIFHNAKKISQNGDPDPTITSNSYGFTSSTGNTNSVVYSTGYRGNTLNYTGNGSNTIVQANGGAARNTKSFSIYYQGSSIEVAYSGSGQYDGGLNFGSADNSSTESAIAAGVIVVTSAGNTNQKLADATDVDFNNWYSTSTNYICRVGGVGRGFSGTNDSKNLGSIRVGALDCAVEPESSLQGVTPYKVRKVVYSANGPMINIWSPGEYTMAAGYAGTYEDYQRVDDTNFYDTWFNGTSAACPNAASLICLYLESNRKANQDDVREWLDTHGSVEIDLSDPYPGINDTGYWSQSYNATYDAATANNSYNVRGNGNLRGATKRVIHNPYANNVVPKITGTSLSGISFKQS